MRTSTIAKVTNVLPALSVFTTGRTARVGKRVRLYQGGSKVTTSPAVQTALVTLLSANASVRVYEGDAIYDLRLDGSTVVWEQRSSKKTRSTAVVEVVL